MPPAAVRPRKMGALDLDMVMVVSRAVLGSKVGRRCEIDEVLQSSYGDWEGDEMIGRRSSRVE